jgi:hypothetical protein
VPYSDVLTDSCPPKAYHVSKERYSIATADRGENAKIKLWTARRSSTPKDYVSYSSHKWSSKCSLVNQTRRRSLVRKGVIFAALLVSSTAVIAQRQMGRIPGVIEVCPTHRLRHYMLICAPDLAFCLSNRTYVGTPLHKSHIHSPRSRGSICGGAYRRSGLNSFEGSASPRLALPSFGSISWRCRRLPTQIFVACITLITLI